MTTVEVILGASAGDSPCRVANREWVTGWWESLGYPVTVGMCDGPWRKAEAYNTAAARSDADVLVIADADVIADPATVACAAADAADCWAVPVDTVHRLTPAATAAALACDPGGCVTPPEVALDQPAHRALPGGGLFAVASEAWAAAGGFDPRFVGWGGEDYALGCALRTLAGPPARHTGPLWHLWHLPQPGTRQPSAVNDPLALRYRWAKFDPARMSALIDEWRYM